MTDEQNIHNQVTESQLTHEGEILHSPIGWGKLYKKPDIFCSYLFLFYTSLYRSSQPDSNVLSDFIL